MAVTSANLQQETADESVGEVRYTQTWVVQTDAADLASTVLAYPGLPVIGGVYVGDVRATCKRRFPSLVGFEQSRQVWNVLIEYSTKEDDEEEDDQEPPLNRLAKWSGTFQQFQSVAEKDRDGAAILNTAGDAFDPPLMKDDSRPIITCVKNFASLNLNFWAGFRDAINSGAWGVYAAKTVKVVNISWETKFDGPTVYYEMTFSFQINPDTWDDEVLNRGFRQIEVAGQEPKLITVSSDVGEIAISEPALLDADGKLIPKANLPANAHFITAKKYVLKDFGTLGIPNPGVRA